MDEYAKRKFSEELRRKRARCSRYCATWNREDKDCEIYGEHHPAPSCCPFFLQSALAEAKTD